MSNILLIRPSFPDSRNSVFRIPVGLCKLASYHKSLGDTVYYVEGMGLNSDIPYDNIDKVYVTSMFTYWSHQVIDVVNFYKKICVNASVVCGGIYASIAPEHIKNNSNVDEVTVGVIPEVEKFYPDYSILPRDNEDINNTQIIWASRGCMRRCDHCYVHIIEPDIYFKDVSEVKKQLLTFKDRKNVLFYDNSLLQHPDLHNLLNMLKDLHKSHKFIYNCTQGIDGRMMKKWEEEGIPVARLMKESKFYDLRFSYDWAFQKESVYYCVEKFEHAGYKRSEMQIFVVINSRDSPETIESRYWEIYDMGCQIHSDRFRPGDMFYDNYHRGGTDYFINSEYGWTNLNIRGTLKFMSALNYANRMNCLYVEAESMQKSKEFNKGKSSMKLDTFIEDE